MWDLPQRPWPFTIVVSPPLWKASMWSRCLIGLSQPGWRQRASRLVMILASVPLKRRRRWSQSVKEWSMGSVNSRRIQAWPPEQMIRRANAAGMGPKPGMATGLSSMSRRLPTVMTKPISTPILSAVLSPVTRWTNSSHIT